MEAVANGVAGSAGSVIAISLVYPLEKLSKEMQTSGERSMSRSVQAILTHRGPAGFYQGISSGLVAMASTQFVFFGSHSFVKALLGSLQPGETLSAGMDMLAGLGAGVLTAVLSEPIWMINTRLMLKSSQAYDGIVDCIKKVYRQEGLKAFFAGLGGAFGIVLGSAIQLTCYEQLKKLVTGLSPNALKSAVVVFVLGALCKCIATVATFPLTTAGSIMQTQASSKPEGRKGRQPYTGTLDCIYKVASTQGVGVVCRVAASAVAIDPTKWFPVHVL